MTWYGASLPATEMLKGPVIPASSSGSTKLGWATKPTLIWFLSGLNQRTTYLPYKPTVSLAHLHLAAHHEQPKRFVALCH